MEEAITHTNASRIGIAAVMDYFPSFTCSKVVITRWHARARKPKET